MSITTRLKRLNAQCESHFKQLYPVDEKIIVFGEGAEKPILVLIGEAPGEQETLQRRPFVGKAGKNLDAFLETLQLTREALYVTNVVKIRPIKASPRTGRAINRPPTREEIELWKPFLTRELAILEPSLIVTLGNVSLQTLWAGKATIGQMHGQALSLSKDTVLFPLYHPASIIYNRALSAVYQDDLSHLAELLKSRKAP